MDKQTSEEPWLSPKGGYSRRVVLRRLMAAGASASGLGLLVGCGSSAVEVAEEPTVTRIPVEGAPTDVPADFVAGASPVVEEGGEVAEDAPAGEEGEEVAEATGGQEHVVEMTDELVFDPDNLTINVGDTVTWTTVGAAPHTSTADPEQALNPEFVKLPEGAETWDSGLVPTGESFSHTFEVPGEYVYFCTPHQMVGMVASLTVVEGGDVAEAPAAEEGGEVAEDAPAVEEGEEGAEATGGQEHVVEMTDELVFDPSELAIKVGDTVTWTTVGAAPHTSTADPEQALDPEFVKLPEGAETWDSGMVNTGESFSHTFEVPGEYVYFCTPHQTVGMVASLTVTE